MAEESEKPQKSKSGIKRLIFEIFLFVLVALVAAGGVFLLAKQRPEVLGLSSASDSEVQKIVRLVSKLIDLPVDETPTVATVSDEEKMREQKFFQNTKNDDKVLVYTNAGKAILYRPSENKIIEVGLLNDTQIPEASVAPATPEPTPTATPEAQSFNVSIFNGTQDKDLMALVESKLKSSNPQANVIEKENAVKRDYEESFVVDLTKQREAEASSIASSLGIGVKQMPEGETTPLVASEFVIVVGADLVEE